MTAEERDRESLSAVMDGEAQELEVRRTLDAVAGDSVIALAIGGAHGWRV